MTPAPRAKPRHLESQMQREFVKRTRLDARTRHVMFCAVPNGGKRNIREAALMKAEGVTAGVPDILVFDPSSRTDNFFSGLAIEFKVTGNKPTEAQALWHLALIERGWNVIVCTSADAGFTAVLSHLGKHRG